MNAKQQNSMKGKRGSSKRRKFRLRWPRALVALYSKVLWPFRVVKNSFDHWRPFAIVRAIFRRGKSITKWLVWGTSSGAASPNSLQQQEQYNWPQSKHLYNPIWWCRWLLAFVTIWASTRSMRAFILATPALVFAFLFATCVSLGYRVSNHNRMNRYVSYRVGSIKNKDLSNARLSADTLVKAQPQYPQHQFNRALVEDQLGDKAAAFAMMTDLATYKRSSAAAMWLAASVGDLQHMDTWSHSQLTQYSYWLELATTNAPQAVGPRIVLSDLLISRGEFDEAHSVLQPLSQDHFEIAFRVVKLDSLLGRNDRARERAEPLVRTLQSYLRKQPQNLVIRIRCASLLGLLDRTSDAVSTLRDGLVYASTDGQQRLLKRLLVDAILARVAAISYGDASANDLVMRFGMLDDAQRMDESGSKTHEAIIKTLEASMAFYTPEVIEARSRILENLPPDIARFVEGTAALQSGNIQEGKQLLDADIEKDAKSPGLLNNLAHAILIEESPDFEKALTYSNAAVKVLPNHPYLRETRGQILFRMGRYHEAMADLELALEAEELRAGIRVNLASTYENIGMPEKAAEQRALHRQEQASR